MVYVLFRELPPPMVFFILKTRSCCSTLTPCPSNSSFSARINVNSSVTLDTSSHSFTSTFPRRFSNTSRTIRLVTSSLEARRRSEIERPTRRCFSRPKNDTNKNCANVIRVPASGFNDVTSSSVQALLFLKMGSTQQFHHLTLITHLQQPPKIKPRIAVHSPIVIILGLDSRPFVISKVLSLTFV